MPNPIPFSQDRTHRAYDPGRPRFWRALLQADRVLTDFRAGFLGKASPVHFFWGGFDLAVTRFSGGPLRRTPAGIPDLPDAVTREAYSHEVSSAGFWPGSETFPRPPSNPTPTRSRRASAAGLPPGATYDKTLRIFVLPYDTVRTAENPDVQPAARLPSSTTYSAAADTAGWDRTALECAMGDSRASAPALDHPHIRFCATVAEVMVPYPTHGDVPTKRCASTVSFYFHLFANYISNYTSGLPP